MEKDRNTEAISYPGAVPMVRIDGTRIRRLRESRKLTQLYLSTVVGVTTDTISRWENRHYQSIKLENAEKLALALEVPFDEILKQEEQAEPVPPAPEPHTVASDQPQPLVRSRLPVALAVLLFVLLAGITMHSLFFKKPAGSVSAQRILPAHAPPGQPFPVLIRVRSPNESPVALIIKELFPPGTQASEGTPPITNIDAGAHSLKWVQRTDQDESVYAYMCRIPVTAQQGDTLTFEGTVTLKQDVGEQHGIEGAVSLTVAPFHWADVNLDNMIDDEEILSVYDIYSDIEKLPFDRDLVDSLWAASSYQWDPDTMQFYPVD